MALSRDKARKVSLLQDLEQEAQITSGVRREQQPQPQPAGVRQPLHALHRAVGNQAVGRLLRAGLLQPRLNIGRPNDRYEREADRVAKTVTTRPEPAGPADETVQRDVQEETGNSREAPHISRVIARPPEEPPALPGRAGLRSKGRPLPRPARAFFEPRFGRDFSGVRVHTGPEAAGLARALNAAAFTVGQDLVFDAGQFAPNSGPGRQLLAHELTHVVQQAGFLGRAPLVQRRLAGPSAAPPAAGEPHPATPGLLVEDSAAGLEQGQMRKSRFLDRLNASICDAAEAELAGTGRTTEGCPYLDYWFDYYRRKDSRHIERAIHRYEPRAAGVTTAGEYIPLITDRVRQGVRTWARTGRITGVPEELANTFPLTGPEAPTGVPAPSQPPVFFKSRDGTPRQVDDPRAIQSQLGAGQPLIGSTRAQMESAFGTDFSQVRVHRDAKAAQLSDRFNAYAFTVGQDIAFGSGEPQPGTPVGDAILAHELAHVVQQRGAPLPEPGEEPGYKALEADADRSALSVVAAQWHRIKGRLKDIVPNAKPRLKSGLRLQRCGFMVPSFPDIVFEEQITLNGDTFWISIYLEDKMQGTKKVSGRYLSIDIDYTGQDDAFNATARFVLDAPDNLSNPTVKQQQKTEGSRQLDQILIDTFGDGTFVLSLTHEFFALKGLSPPIRHHEFCAEVTGKTTRKEGCRSIDVKPWLAQKVPQEGGEEAAGLAEPVTTPVPIGGQGQAATLTTSSLMEIILQRLSAIQPHAPAVESLIQAIRADLARPAGQGEASLRARVERLNETLVAIQPVFGALSDLAQAEHYLPGIASQVVGEANAIKKRYVDALQAVYAGTDSRGEVLLEAEMAMVRFPNFVVKLFLSNEGISSLFTDMWSLRNDIRRLRAETGRTATVTRPADKLAGLDLRYSNPLEQELDRDLRLARKARFYESQDVSDRVRKLTLETQAYVAILTGLALYEQFIYWEKLLDESIINGTIELAFSSKLDLARQYRQKIDQILTTFEKYGTAKTGQQKDNAIRQGTADLNTLISSKDFKETVAAIQDRLKTIETIDIMGKMVLIIAASALTSGAAAAAVGGALRGLALSATAIRTGTFVAEVLAFTVTSRVGQKIAFGRVEGSLAEDLVWNAAMFGVLKSAMSGFNKIFTRFRDPQIHKIAFGLGRAGTAVVSLHAFAEAQHFLRTGKVMTGEERAMAALQNLIMVVALEAGRFITKPLEQRIETAINNKLKTLFQARYESLQTERLALLQKLEKLSRGKATKEEVETLLRDIQSLWAREIKLLSDGAKQKAFSQAELDKATQPYKQQIARMELRLAQLGVTAPLGAQAAGFRPLARGVVAYTPEAQATLEAFYKGNLKKSAVADMLEGRSPTGEVTFYVLEGTAPKNLPALERIVVARDLARLEASQDALAAKGLKQLKDMNLGERKIDELLATADPANINIFLRALADPAYNAQIGSNFYSGLAARPQAINFARTYGGDVLMRLYRTYGKRWSDQFMDVLGRATAKLEAAPTSAARQELLQALRTTTDAAKIDTLLGKQPPPQPSKPARATKANMGVDRSRIAWKAFRAEAARFAKAHGESLTPEQLDLRADLDQALDAARRGRLDRLGHNSKIEILDRFDELAQKSGMVRTWINAKRGSLSELLFNPARGKRKLTFKGGVEAPWGTKDATVPDYSIESTGFTEWVNQKSDLIDQGIKRGGVFANGLAAARTYRRIADREAGNLPPGDKYSLDFVRDPGPATRQAMLDILKASGSPVFRVKFGEVWY